MKNQYKTGAGGNHVRAFFVISKIPEITHKIIVEISRSEGIEFSTPWKESK